MDKDTLEILKRQDKYSTRMFYLSCLLALLLVISIFTNTYNVNKMSSMFEQTVVEVARINSAKEIEAVRLYFETDYGYGDYDNSVSQEVEVNN